MVMSARGNRTVARQGICYHDKEYYIIDNTKVDIEV